MNKILRYSLIALLAFVANVSFAQTIVWSEDFSNYEANAAPTGGTYGYVCVDGESVTKVYNEKLAGGDAPEILVSKSGGSFSATVNLAGKSGDMTLAFKCNKKLTVSVEGATLGDVVASGNDYSYPVSVAEGTESVTITFSMTTSSNARLDNIKLFQGEAKKPAGLSWGTASRTVTLGSSENTFPTLTNANELAVTYSSSDEEVATIDAEGVITLLKAGTTDITAEFAGNDEYEAGKVTYALTVKDAPAVDLTNTPETAYSVAKALELIAAGEGLETKVYVKGIISKVVSVDTGSYGNANYNISDDGTAANELMVFRGFYLDGEKFTSEDQIQVGDEVIVYGNLINYKNTTPEVNTGSQIYSLNRQATAISTVTTVAASEAPLYNLAGQKVNKEYKGVVIQNGKKFVNK